MAKKKAAAPETQGPVVNIPTIRREMMEIEIRGLSPGYLSHRFSDKQRDAIRDKQQKKAPTTTGRQAKDPDGDFHGSIYFIGDDPGTGNEAEGRFGCPAISFKLATVAACRLIEGVSMVEARQMFFIRGCDDAPHLVEIEGCTPIIQEDVVKTPPRTGAADLRYRALFQDWTATLRVEYLANCISAEQLINLINLGGFSVGIGDWRPEKSGNYGRYEIVSL